MIKYDDILKIIFNSEGPTDMAKNIMRKIDHEHANLEQKIILLRERLSKPRLRHWECQEEEKR